MENLDENLEKLGNENQNIVSEIKEIVQDTISDAEEKVQQTISNVQEAIEPIVEVVDTVVDTFKTVASTIKYVKGRVNEVEQSLQQYNSSMDLYEEKYQELKPTVDSLTESVKKLRVQLDEISKDNLKEENLQTYSHLKDDLIELNHLIVELSKHMVDEFSFFDNLFDSFAKVQDFIEESCDWFNFGVKTLTDVLSERLGTNLDDRYYNKTGTKTNLFSNFVNNAGNMVVDYASEKFHEHNLENIKANFIEMFAAEKEQNYNKLVDFISNMVGTFDTEYNYMIHRFKYLFAYYLSDGKLDDNENHCLTRYLRGCLYNIKWLPWAIERAKHIKNFYDLYEEKLENFSEYPESFCNWVKDEILADNINIIEFAEDVYTELKEDIQDKYHEKLDDIFLMAFAGEPSLSYQDTENCPNMARLRDIFMEHVAQVYQKLRKHKKPQLIYPKFAYCVDFYGFSSMFLSINAVTVYPKRIESAEEKVNHVKKFMKNIINWTMWFPLILSLIYTFVSGIFGPTAKFYLGLEFIIMATYFLIKKLKGRNLALKVVKKQKYDILAVDRELTEIVNSMRDQGTKNLGIEFNETYDSLWTNQEDETLEYIEQNGHIKLAETEASSANENVSCESQNGISEPVNLEKINSEEK